MTWALTATCVGMLTLGVFVLHREAYGRAGRAFFFLMPPAIVWFGCFAVLHACLDPDAALLWSRLGYLGVPFIAAAITQFAVTLTGRRRPLLVGALFATSGLFSVAFLSSNAFISGIQRFSWGFYPRYGMGGLAFTLYFAGAITGSLMLLGFAYAQATAARARARYRAYLVSFALMAFAAVDFFPKFGFDVFPFSFVAISAILAVMAWANWRYRLVDITPAFAADEILDTLQSAVVVTDFYGTVRVLNGAAAALLGRRSEDFIGRTLGSLGFQVRPRIGGDRPSIPYRGFQCVLSRPDGKPVDLELSATWLTDATSARIGIVYAANDVSERLREASELARSTAEKDQLELFTAIAAHDLRKPLNHIGAFADLTASAVSDHNVEAAKTYLGRIRAAAQRVEKMIEGLLRYERSLLDSGDTAEVNLNAIMDDIGSSLEPSIAEPGWLSFDPLPSVRGSALQLRQLFENLILNAAKFRHPDRALRVEVGWRRSGDDFEIFIRDNGIGFRQEDADRVFMPFARLDAAAGTDGHGLGLAICRRIAVRHGGKIEAAGRPGDGAVFTVSFPGVRLVFPRSRRADSAA